MGRISPSFSPSCSQQRCLPIYPFIWLSIDIHQYPSISINIHLSIIYINEISINIHLYPFISIITHMTYYYIHHHRLAPDELPIGEPCRYPAGSARRLGATEQREGLGGAWYVLPKYGLEKRTTWNYQMNFDVFFKNALILNFWNHLKQTIFRDMYCASVLILLVFVSTLRAEPLGLDRLSARRGSEGCTWSWDQRSTHLLSRTSWHKWWKIHHS